MSIQTTQIITKEKAIERISEIVCVRCLPEVENHHVKNLSKFPTGK